MKLDLLEKLKSGVVIGDGAMGTYLYELGLPLDQCCEELALTHPELVRQVHQDYIEAGAEVIETNSFGANRFKLARRGFEDRVEEINIKAAELARKIAGKKDVMIAGSVGPLGIPLEDARSQKLDVQDIFQEQIRALLKGGVDFILFETFSNLEELKVAIAAIKKLGKEPLFCSMSFTEDGVTHCGVNIADAFAELQKLGAKVLGANCSIGPRPLAAVFKNLSPLNGEYYAAMPNAGRPEFMDGRYHYLTTPQYFAEQGLELVRNGARFIGGCCGTKPEHIAALKKVLKEEKTTTRTPSQPRLTATRVIKVSEPISRPTLLDVIKQRTLIVTEFDSPKTLVMDKMIEAAKALKAAGTDFLTVADNSLAILRTNCVVASHLVEHQTGLRSIVHMACRDRNLIGTQSELMGMDALGLDHVLALTGDPSKVGDSPGATSVYDLNSISLLEGIRAMNGGKSFGGRDLKRPARFVAGCSFNPNAKNLQVQVQRLERKIAAGAQFVMTQPVFDAKLVKATFEVTSQFKVPVLVGVMPLLSGRNAEFLHNEVPGIVIPDNVRERMRNKDGDSGQEEGLAIAKEMSDEILSCFKGIYLITPFVRYEVTVDLSSAIRDGKL